MTGEEALGAFERDVEVGQPIRDRRLRLNTNAMYERAENVSD